MKIAHNFDSFCYEILIFPIISESLISNFGLEYIRNLSSKQIILVITRIDNSTEKHGDGFYSIALLPTCKSFLYQELLPLSAGFPSGTRHSCRLKQKIIRDFPMHMRFPQVTHDWPIYKYFISV